MKQDIDFFSIMPEDKIAEKGRVLISEPFLPDSFFNRSIVYLAEHSPEGSIGFILNKVLDLNLNDAITGFDTWQEPLYMGGPVAPDTLHYIHTLGDIIPKSVWVHSNIFMGGDIDTIRTMITNGIIKKHQIRFFLGYSGWSKGQLEAELRENSWVIAQVSSDIIMKNKGVDTWKKVLRSLNNKYRIWADFPDSPDMN
jgi:putative transcriptional regulator